MKFGKNIRVLALLAATLWSAPAGAQEPSKMIAADLGFLLDYCLSPTVIPAKLLIDLEKYTSIGPLLDRRQIKFAHQHPDALVTLDSSADEQLEKHIKNEKLSLNDEMKNIKTLRAERSSGQAFEALTTTIVEAKLSLAKKTKILSSVEAALKSPVCGNSEVLNQLLVAQSDRQLAMQESGCISIGHSESWNCPGPSTAHLVEFMPFAFEEQTVKHAPKTMPTVEKSSNPTTVTTTTQAK